jgi:hypothetical protein
MTTPAEYYEFALDCMRWSKDAKDASQRDILINVGRRWTETALRVERHAIMAADKSKLFKELRAKLD